MKILERILDDLDNFKLDVVHIVLAFLTGLMFIFMLTMFMTSYDSEIKRYGERAAIYKEIAEHLRDRNHNELWEELKVVE
jgi:hypothetical protein